MTEKIIIDREFDNTVEEIQSLIDKFFFDNIRAPFDMDVTIEMDGAKQIWVIPPEERGEGSDEKLVNGWVEIKPISRDNDMPVHLRIASSREELTALWFDLKNFIEASLLVQSIPPSVIARPISKQLILGKQDGKRKEKRGRPTPPDDVKLRALIEWDELDKSITGITLDEWLGIKFGYEGRHLRVSTQTFHGWRQDLRGKELYDS